MLPRLQPISTPSPPRPFPGPKQAGRPAHSLARSTPSGLERLFVGGSDTDDNRDHDAVFNRML